MRYAYATRVALAMALLSIATSVGVAFIRVS